MAKELKTKIVAEVTEHQLFKALEELSYNIATREEQIGDANKAVEAVKAGYKKAHTEALEKFYDNAPGKLMVPIANALPQGMSPSYIDIKSFKKAAELQEDTLVGFTCTRCGLRNEQAEANQADGTYLCFQCRS